MIVHDRPPDICLVVPRHASAFLISFSSTFRDAVVLVSLTFGKGPVNHFRADKIHELHAKMKTAMMSRTA